MKRFLTLAVIVLFVMLPLVASARTVITDKDLDAITAESGVSIDLINVRMGGTGSTETTMTSFSWGDTSGFTPSYTSPGYFGFRNVSITGYLTNITSGTMRLDLGTSGGTGETKMFMVLPTVTLGTANISGWLYADRIATLDSATASQGGVLSVNGFSTQLSGTLAVYAHP